MLRLFKCNVKICMPNKAERVRTQSMLLSVGKEPCGQEEVPGQNRCTWALLSQGSIHNRDTDFCTLHGVTTERGAQPDFCGVEKGRMFAHSYSSSSIQLITPI
jgi:hypothetical protein